MRIGILGTGDVGRTLAAKLSELGHDVVMGTRDVEELMKRSAPDGRGSAPFPAWSEKNPKVRVATFADAAAHGEVLMSALSGGGALEGLRAAGSRNLSGKILVDIANPLDFSKGFPPTLSVVNTDSLGEQVQREFADLRVVKALNTVTAALMIDPKQLANGDHTLFICGNDESAKKEVTRLLGEWFGWKDVIDVGDITNARGTEMLLALWIRLYGTFKTGMFNFKVVR